MRDQTVQLPGVLSALEVGRCGCTLELSNCIEAQKGDNLCANHGILSNKNKMQSSCPAAWCGLCAEGTAVWQHA